MVRWNEGPCGFDGSLKLKKLLLDGTLHICFCQFWCSGIGKGFWNQKETSCFLCWIQDSNPEGLWNWISSRLNAHWQTDRAIKDQAHSSPGFTIDIWKWVILDLRFKNKFHKHEKREKMTTKFYWEGHLIDFCAFAHICVTTEILHLYITF